MISDEPSTALPTPDEIKDLCATAAQGILTQRVKIYELEKKTKAFEEKWIKPLENRKRQRRQQ